MNQELARVVVIGSTGSGKTTFARRLADCLQSTHIELDAINWQPNWTARPRAELRELTRNAVAAERWVVDGNYSAVRDIVWPAATSIIWLNYSFPRVFGRLLHRTVRRAFTQEELFSGNRESFRLSFLDRESILWWLITTHRRRKREYRRLFAEGSPSNTSLREFRHPAQAEAFIQSLDPA
jgi:adenylate kinase family enzyme